MANKHELDEALYHAAASSNVCDDADVKVDAALRLFHTALNLVPPDKIRVIRASSLLALALRASADRYTIYSQALKTASEVAMKFAKDPLKELQ